jgi:hypothetical protein
MKSTHSARLERWLGAEQVASLTNSMRGWYGPPIAVHGVPGAVYATADGDFIGEIRGGQEMDAISRACDVVKKYQKNRMARMALSRKQLGAFGSLSALITAATTGGKLQNQTFQKTGTASNATGNAMSLFKVGAQPAAGGAAAAAPGGTSPTSATTGSLPLTNAPNANTNHFTTGYVTASVVPNTLLMYDRLYAVPFVIANTAVQGVTGQTSNRYQNTSSSGTDFIGGNFVFPEIASVLPATGHNWTVCKYTNQAGVTGQSFASTAGISAGAANAIDLAAGSWFLPLAAGDSGVKTLTQVQCSASLASGSIEFVVGHPIAFFPCPIANMMCLVDGITTAFNLQFVFDNACLSFLEMPKSATTATTYSGQIQLVSE